MDSRRLLDFCSTLTVDSAGIYGTTVADLWQGKRWPPMSCKGDEEFCLYFGMLKGSLFGPYTPLQHLDILADVGTKSYIVGSTNSLLLQQRDRYSDILINV